MCVCVCVCTMHACGVCWCRSGVEFYCWYISPVPSLMLHSSTGPFTDFETRLRCLAELKRPSVLNGCKVNTKAAHCHFWRYSDLRTKGVCGREGVEGVGRTVFG